MMHLSFYKIYLVMTLAVSLQGTCYSSTSSIKSINRNNNSPMLLEEAISTGEEQAISSSITTSSSSSTVSNTDRTNKLTPRKFLWTIPFLVGIGSYQSFGFTSHRFHRLVQWVSKNTWIPSTDEKVNLQTNVVTQVVNGPVITSISILFATLSSMTISTLYNRQMDIRKCYTIELQLLRQLRLWIAAAPPSTVRQTGEELLVQYTKQLFQENEHQDHSHFSSGDMHLVALLKWCNELFFPSPLSPSKNHHKKNKSSSSFLPLEFVEQFQSSVAAILEQRNLRWMALSSDFPFVHWMTLTVLAVSIAVSFLVATDQQDFIFLEGLQVRILWTLLMTSFASLAVLCYDLSLPFGGAYQAFTSNVDEKS